MAKCALLPLISLVCVAGCEIGNAPETAARPGGGYAIIRIVATN